MNEILIKLFTQNMDSQLYAEIIHGYIFPFAGEKFNFQMNLHQDNDSKHSSKLCSNVLKELKLNWVYLIIVLVFISKFSSKALCLFKKIKSPPKSPDLNPIELLWSDLKRYVRKQLCKNSDEVIEAVHRFHASITPEVCKRYIGKIKKANIFNFNFHKKIL